MRTLHPDVYSSLVNTYNAASAHALEMGLIACAREIWLIAALGLWVTARVKDLRAAMISHLRMPTVALMPLRCP